MFAIADSCALGSKLGSGAGGVKPVSTVIPPARPPAVGGLPPHRSKRRASAGREWYLEGDSRPSERRRRGKERTVDTAGVVFRLAAAFLVLGVGVVGFTLLPTRPWSLVGRAVGFGALGLVVAAVVFGLQSGNVGASVGGAVLALAIGAITVLLVMLFRSV
jgi:hypothetical protein